MGNGIFKPLILSIILLAAFFSFMYYEDQIHKKQYEEEKALLTKTQAEAENEKKMYGSVTDTTQHKLDSLQKDITAVEKNK